MAWNILIRDQLGRRVVFYLKVLVFAELGLLTICSARGN
jgi:hypothetical protein